MEKICENEGRSLKQIPTELKYAFRNFSPNFFSAFFGCKSKFCLSFKIWWYLSSKVLRQYFFSPSKNFKIKITFKKRTEIDNTIQN